MSATTDPRSADSRSKRAERHLSALDRMLETGTALLEQIHPAVTPAPTLADQHTRATTYDTLCRALRRTMLLADHFETVTDAARQRAEARRLTNPPRPSPKQGEAAQTNPNPDRPDRDRPDRDRIERLDSIADLTAREPAEAVATLARDYARFGLRPRARTAPEHVPGTIPFDPAPFDLVDTILKHGKYPRDG